MKVQPINKKLRSSENCTVSPSRKAQLCDRIIQSLTSQSPHLVWGMYCVLVVAWCSVAEAKDLVAVDPGSNPASGDHLLHVILSAIVK